MQQTNKRYPLGAHLIVKHLGYSHHGIYAGRGRVIHYSGLAHFIKKIHVRSYDAPRYRGKVVVRRMRSRMHENHYHLIINNCEHLCSWAITGIESSTQVERMMHRLTTIGYVSSIMSYMNGMMLTVATTCFALVLYIKKKLRDQAKMNIPTYQFLREKAEKRNIDPTSPLVFIEPDKKETI